VTRDETAWTWWDAAACDRWVPGPEVPQVHPGLLPFVLDYPEHAEPRVRPGPPAASRGIRLPGARDPPPLDSDDGAAGRRGAGAAAYFLQRALPAQWTCPGSPRVTAGAAVAVCDWVAVMFQFWPICPWIRVRPAK
jgi:hypothetical protein